MADKNNCYFDGDLINNLQAIIDNIHDYQLYCEDRCISFCDDTTWAHDEYCYDNHVWIAKALRQLAYNLEDAYGYISAGRTN